MLLAGCANRDGSLSLSLSLCPPSPGGAGRSHRALHHLSPLLVRPRASFSPLPLSFSHDASSFFRFDHLHSRISVYARVHVYVRS